MNREVCKHGRLVDTDCEVCDIESQNLKISNKLYEIANKCLEFEAQLKEAEKVIDYYATEENYNFAKNITFEAEKYLEKYKNENLY